MTPTSLRQPGPLRLPDGFLQVLKDAVKQVPKGKKVEIPVEVLAQLLEFVVERRSVPLTGDAASFFASPEELAEQGQGEVTIDEAARMLGITNQAVQYAIRVGKLAARRVGKRLLLVDVASVRAYRTRTPSGSRRPATEEPPLEADLSTP